MADPSSNVPLKTLSATIRATQDIWCRRDDDDDDDDGDDDNHKDSISRGAVTYQLFPSAALHLLDHHWHTSGLIPHVYSVSNQTSVIYEQDWMCTFQSITCFTQDGLVELTVEDGASGSAQTHVWIDRVGPSTLYVSQMITLYDQVLATAVRFMRRRQAIPAEVMTTTTTTTTDITPTSSPEKYHQHQQQQQQVRRHWKISAPFTPEEREYFEQECAADDVILEYQVQLVERLEKEEDAESVDDETGNDNENQNQNGEDMVQTNSEVVVEEEEGNKATTKSSQEKSSDESSPDGDLGHQDTENNRNGVESGGEEQEKRKTLEDSGTDTGMSSISGSSTATTSPTSSDKKKSSNKGRENKNKDKKQHRKMTLSSTLSLETYGTFLPCIHGHYLLTVRVGPQHLDFVSGGDARFADTTWLAEVAFQALVEAQLLGSPPTTTTTTTKSKKWQHHSSPSSPRSNHQNSTTSMAIQYLSFAILGNQLHCNLHGDRVCMVRSAMTEWGEKKGDQVLVLVAKADPL